MITKNTFKEHVLRVIAVIGLIAVLLLGAWGIIQLAFSIPTFLSNLAGGTASPAAKEVVVVSAPASVTANQAFDLSWSHTGGDGQYSYAVSYSCANGISVKAPLPTGALQSVPCNTPFNYTGAASHLQLTVVDTATGQTPVSFAVSSTKLSSGAITATGSVTTSIAGAKAPAKTVSKPATSKYVASAQPRPALYGTPDLSVRIVSNPGSVRAGSQVSLQFVIENTGTNVVPQNWIFTASLPYSPAYTYQSPAQPALYPGDKIVYTLGFTAQYQQDPNFNPCTGWSFPCTNPTPVYGGPGTCNAFGPCATAGGYQQNVYSYSYQQQNYGGVQNASVTVDPYNLVWESNESNNTAGISYQVY